MPQLILRQRSSGPWCWLRAKRRRLAHSFQTWRALHDCLKEKSAIERSSLLDALGKQRRNRSNVLRPLWRRPISPLGEYRPRSVAFLKPLKAIRLALGRG
jgi:hypothetical protein